VYGVEVGGQLVTQPSRGGDLHAARTAGDRSVGIYLLVCMS
jgi:hypothetical protein